MNFRGIFAVACLGLASVIGCGAEGTLDDGSSPSAAAEQTTVVRIGAEEFAALKPGETVRVDLNASDKVYVVQYSSPPDLKHVLVIDDNAERILSEMVPATAKAREGTTNQVVLASDPELAKEFAEPSGHNAVDRTMSTEEGELGIVSQPLPPRCCEECHEVPGGYIVCSGCGPC
jgi:hypothetical protein